MTEAGFARGASKPDIAPIAGVSVSRLQAKRTPIAILLKGYPRLSETFVAQEILALERAGLDLQLYSMRFPTDLEQHPVHGEIRAPVTYLPEYLHLEPLRVLRAWRRARHMPGYVEAKSLFLSHLRRDPSRNRFRRFGQAIVLATELAPEVEHVHAHFLHTPASVADYAAVLSGRSWSFSAHAKDIWTIPEWEKRGKLARARWGVTCTRVGHQHLQNLMPHGRADGIVLVYHGLDLKRFPPPPDRSRMSDGSDAGCPVVIVSVGRIVEKKGFDTLIEALARLPDHLAWRFIHIGGGSTGRLEALAAKRGIGDRVQFLGAKAQAGVIETLRAGDLFVLASRIAGDGDRDGLPNVLMEAQSQALACISTQLAGIAELIVEGVTGLLVPPNDPDALAGAVECLIGDPALRARLGDAGRGRLVEAFTFDACIARLLPCFGVDVPKQGMALTAAE